MDVKNVIAKTGQSWKLLAVFVVLILSGISMVIGVLNINAAASAELYFYYVSACAIVGISSFVIACVSIKCPSCGSRWLWSAVNSKASKEWQYWLNSLEVCPECGEPKNEQV